MAFGITFAFAFKPCKIVVNSTIMTFYGKSLFLALLVFVAWNNFLISFPAITTKQSNVMSV